MDPMCYSEEMIQLIVDIIYTLYLYICEHHCRCNDVLELVQTTRHFRLLADAAEIGGAGSQSLDALVKEIHQNYVQAMNEFFSQVTNVLDIDGTQSFETAFFTFRTIVKVNGLHPHNFLYLYYTLVLS